MTKGSLLRIAALTAFGLAFLVAIPVSRLDADQSDSTRIIGYNGFAGWWDRFGVAHPSFHHRVECEPQYSGWYTSKQACYRGPGDWSLDYYNNPGTWVRYNAFPQGGTLTARVWAIQPTCVAGPSAGGWTVFVDVYISGSWEGWMSYGHLDQIQVSPGQWISPGQLLGRLKRWPYSTGCWEVTTDQGVHSHVEFYNAFLYACYINYASGTYLAYPSGLGLIGRTIYTAPRSPC